MTSKYPDIAQYEFIDKFKLLIKRISPGSIKTTVDFVILLHGILAEVKGAKAENLIITIPTDSMLFKREIKRWTFKYLLPQMQTIGIKRVAFVIQHKYVNHPETICDENKDFEVGIFSYLAEATAWILKLSASPYRTSTCSKNFQQNCKI
ncbi:MAG: hypothetical protein RBS07_13680 [Lentimicrobium sp.]|jgi:hypothetical protein|nr:hypothetical protein [Lentimicrobium sp.]